MLGRSRARGRWNCPVDQVLGIVDEHAIVDFASGRRGGRTRHTGAPHRRAVGDNRMAIDALEDNRPIGNDGVEVGSGREFLDRPQFLIPAAAEDPFVSGCAAA